MAWPMFDLGSFCTLVTLDSRTATVGRLSFQSRSLMWFRGRVSVKLLKTGRIRIDYLDHSHQGPKTLRKRAHNPLLKEAGLTKPTAAVPWLGGRLVRLACPCRPEGESGHRTRMPASMR